MDFVFYFRPTGLCQAKAMDYWRHMCRMSVVRFLSSVTWNLPESFLFPISLVYIFSFSNVEVLWREHGSIRGKASKDVSKTGKRMLSSFGDTFFMRTKTVCRLYILLFFCRIFIRRSFCFVVSSFPSILVSLCTETYFREVISLSSTFLPSMTTLPVHAKGIHDAAMTISDSNYQLIERMLN